MALVQAVEAGYSDVEESLLNVERHLEQRHQCNQLNREVARAEHIYNHRQHCELRVDEHPDLVDDDQNGEGSQNDGPNHLHPPLDPNLP